MAKRVSTRIVALSGYICVHLCSSVAKIGTTVSKPQHRLAAVGSQVSLHRGRRRAKGYLLHPAVGEQELRPADMRRTPVVLERLAHRPGIADDQDALVLVEVAEAALGAAGTADEERLIPVPGARGIVGGVHGLLAQQDGVRQPIGYLGAAQALRAIGDDQGIGRVVGLAPGPAAAAVVAVLVVDHKLSDRRAPRGASVQLEGLAPVAGLVDVSPSRKGRMA